VNVPEPGDEELLMLPYRQALERIGAGDVHLKVIAPPYPALGVGTLHVVRVTHDDKKTVLDATYDDYERLP
jgi:hypothetical protein